MDIMDILGPVMVGPSSSHTAGAARIGKITRMILKSTPVNAKIYFHGSFASTYQGHGSDCAVVGGLLGFDPDDSRLKDSFQYADEAELDYSFETIQIPDAHPNTILIEAQSVVGEKVRVQGSSIGGGNIIIQMIDDIKVSFDGKYDTLIIIHEDQPGMIAMVSSALAAQHINIAGMKVFRDRRGGDAIMIIESDGELQENTDTSMEALPYISKVISISKLKQ